MGIIERVKQQLPMQDVLKHYGYEIQGAGMILCRQTGEDKPSCHINDNGTFCCYSCSAHGDVIDFIAHEEDCDSKTAIKKAMRMAGISSKDTDFDVEEIKRKIAERDVEKEEMESRLKDVIAHNREVAKRFCEEARDNIVNTSYFLNRGLTNETQRRFNLGYNERTKSVVIPYNRSMTYFITRSTEEKKFFKPRSKFRITSDGKYDYDHTQGILGKEPVWNGGVLSLEGKTVWACESPIDAMSLAQYGLNACAVGGTNAESKFDKYGFKAHVVFAFDSDEPGRTHAEAWAQKYNQFWFVPPREYKDWNEMLVKDKPLFEKVIEMMKIASSNIERVRNAEKKEAEHREVPQQENGS